MRPYPGDLKVEVDGTFTGENNLAKASVDTKTVIFATPVPGDDPGTNWQAREPYFWDARSPSMYGKGGCSAAVTGASGADFVTYPPAGVATKVSGGYLVYLNPIIAVEGTVSGGPCGSAKPWFVYPTLFTAPGLTLKVNGTGPTTWSDSGNDPTGFPGSYDLTIKITELQSVMARSGCLHACSAGEVALISNDKARSTRRSVRGSEKRIGPPIGSRYHRRRDGLWPQPRAAKGRRTATRTRRRSLNRARRTLLWRPPQVAGRL